MNSKLMRSKYNLGNSLFFRAKYNFGICKGFIVGLHDDFVRVQINDDSIVTVKFADVLSIYEK